MLTLKILIENTAPDGLIAEHGLSFLVTTPHEKFIFDCGHTGAAFDNAKILGEDLSTIKFAVLSHAHYDHAGGFPKLLDVAPIETLYTGENFWDEKFSRDGEGYKYRGSGFDENFLMTHDIEQKICRDVVEIDSGAWLVGNFARRYDFETIPKKFVRGEKKLPDNFSDEIVLVLRDGDGLAVVTACAHVGVLNIVADVAERFSLPIRTVIGGLHLTNATEERISRTLTELKTFGVEKILPCHCSGEKFMQHFRERPTTGAVITIRRNEI
ncbi:MAG: MBL fold metallo-hydrolase [Selenomonadaceae bacterium]|nr:MBL fold metallo-hydrolase [Selenomonadaceae bacterium]